MVKTVPVNGGPPEYRFDGTWKDRDAFLEDREPDFEEFPWHY